MRCCFLILSICLTPLVTQAQDAITILPLGDSITAGGGGGGGFYRHHLQDLLSKTDLKFQFVGPKTDAKNLRHAGYGGWNSDRILGVTKELYSQYPADLVLLHMAHNHFAENNPVDKIVANTQSVIETLFAANPKVKIFLAQSITAGKLPKYSYLPDLNIRLASLATKLQDRGVAVILVDQATGFDWKKHTVGDKVHPNEVGAKRMAQVWANAIRETLAATK